MSPILQVDSLPAEPQGKPKNTRMGSLSLLQWIFPTQELNRVLPHCRRILYQLSYQGSSLAQMPLKLTQPKSISCMLAVLSIFGTGIDFMEDNFSTDQGRESSFRMIQTHYIYCTLYF